jgi:hypothetical protein
LHGQFHAPSSDCAVSLASQELYEVECDILTEDGLNRTRTMAPLILPHELFGALHSRSAESWRTHVVNPDVCTKFWQEISTAPYMANHPVATNPSLWSTTVPLGFHGDGAAFTKLDKLMAFSWNPILLPGKLDRLDSRFMVAALPTPWFLSGEEGPITMWQISAVMAWSFAVLLEGCYPACDHNLQPWPRGSHRARLAGQPIAGGFRAIVADYRSDWQHTVMFWRVPDFNAVDAMCFECTASLDGPGQFSDFSDAAAAGRGQRSTAELQGQRLVNPFVLLPGFTLGCIKWDECHLVKLGVARLCVGSAMVVLCRRGVFGALPQDDQLKRAWAQFRDWAHRHRVQHNVRSFTKARLGISGTDFPESATKAWQTRVLIAWLAEVSRDAPDAGANGSNATLALCLHWLAVFFSVMEKAGFFFKPDELATFSNATQQFLASYSALAAEALRTDELLWPIRPKHHGVCHLRLGALADFRNPKRFGCMLDEDFLGRIVKVATKCHRRTMARGVLLRYLTRLVHHWRRPPLRLRHRMWRPRRGVLRRPLPPPRL